MIRPYISGPMSDRTFHNFEAFFEAEASLKAQGYDPINPARYGVGHDHPEFASWEEAFEYWGSLDLTWNEFIRRDTELVCEADGVVLLPDWWKSRGACVEVVVGVNIGNPVYYLKDGEVKRPKYEDEYYSRALGHLVKCGHAVPV